LKEEEQEEKEMLGIVYTGLLQRMDESDAGIYEFSNLSWPNSVILELDFTEY
jgi:hypothetical protein